MRGKLGNTVLFKIKDAATKETQGARVYQPQVSNPQTDAQLDQRVKMQIVNNVYRHLKPIIDRGFEGVSYGNLSRREYLSMALGADFDGPYLPKGDMRAYPILTPISKGSLPEVQTVWSDAGSAFVLPAVSYSSGGDTVGAVSQALISSGLVMEGDQVTVVFAFSLNGSANDAPRYVWDSFYVTSSDARSLGDVVLFEPTSASFGGTPKLGFYSDAGYGTTLAMAVIVSREGSHLRSTARFSINASQTWLTALYQPDQLIAARKSYSKKVRKSGSDWEEDPDSTGGESADGSTFTYRGVEIVGTSVQSGVTCLIDTDGDLYIPRITNERNANYNQYVVGKSFVAASLTTDQPADTSALNLDGEGGYPGDYTLAAYNFINWLAEKLGYDIRLFYTRIS